MKSLYDHLKLEEGNNPRSKISSVNSGEKEQKKGMWSAEGEDLLTHDVDRYGQVLRMQSDVGIICCLTDWDEISQRFPETTQERGVGCH